MISDKDASVPQGSTEGAGQEGKLVESSLPPPPAAEEGKKEDALPPPPAAEEGEKKESGDAPGKPDEPVDYFSGVTVPEGYVLNNELMPRAAELFGKYHLPREAAQEFVTLAVELQRSSAAHAAEQSRASQAESVRKMASEITSRPDFAKEKPLVQLGIANLAREFPRIRELYNDPVFGSMPELWEIALAVGRRFEQEGQLLSAGKDTGGVKNFLEQMYPSMSKSQKQ